MSGRRMVSARARAEDKAAAWRIRALRVKLQTPMCVDCALGLDLLDRHELIARIDQFTKRPTAAFELIQRPICVSNRVILAHRRQLSTLFKIIILPEP